MMPAISRMRMTPQTCKAENSVSLVLLSHQTTTATSNKARIFENEYPPSINVRRG